MAPKLHTATAPVAEALRRAQVLTSFLASRPVARARTGQTPHRVIHRQNGAALRYFPPSGARVRPPLFICMPLINTWTIFDLVPGRSVVEALVQAGVPVYLLDWGRPTTADREVTLQDLVDGVLPRALDRALRHARQHHGSQTLDALGYCVGGTFLAISLARQPGPVRRIALLAAPIDFHASGRLSRWARPDRFPLDDLVDGLGNFPRDLMRASFQALRPTGQIAKYKTLWDRAADPEFRKLWAAIEHWNADNVDFPGEAYRSYVRGCYFDNALMKGGWTLAGRAVDLKKGALSALAIAAEQDHICPSVAAFGLKQAWGGPVRTTTLRGGHVGVCLGQALPRTILSWLDEARP
ncbi:MAG: alpha/beta fold hydrolase [Oligoflexia bacterium]|nr:alpha/beta fold hydrolase [Oligoflexia bacterium]